jgi:diguanylate cyclase (GGDEF)-like protein/PAS domain S-box-containing protein
MDKKIKKQLPWFLPIITALIVLSILFWFGIKEQESLIKKGIDETISQRTLLVNVVAKNIETILVNTKNSAEHLASLLSLSFSSSASKPSDEFNSITSTFPDGSIRSKSDNYNPLNEAGILLPEGFNLNENIQDEILNAKRVIDTYGGHLTNEPYVDSWYMPKSGGIVIYWPKRSTFVYEAKPDFSYADTEWLIAPRSPNKDLATSYWTTLSLDPISNIWMLSAVSPVYVNGNWLGAAGHDIPLVNVISEATLLEQQEGSHFILISSQKALLASDVFAERLKEGDGQVLLSDLPESQWRNSLEKAFKEDIFNTKHAQYIVDDNFITVSYIEEHEWFLITSIPLLPIERTVKNSFETLRNITVISLILEIIILSILLAWGHKKNIQYISKLQNLNSKLHSEKLRYESLVEEMPDIITKVDINGRLTFVNKAAANMFGLSAKACIGKLAFNFIHPDDQLATKQGFASWLEHKNGNFLHENRQVNLNGKVFNVAWSIHGQYDELDNFVGFAGTGRDITERKKSEEKLKLAASVFEHAGESIAITDATGLILDVNETFTNTTGFSRKEAIGRNPSIIQSGQQSPEFYVNMWQALINEGHWHGEIWNRRKNGELYAERKTISAVRNEHGTTTHYVSLGNDITLIKEHQEKLEHIAHYDILTNLPNRSLLSDRLSQAMLQCSRNEKSLAVVFLDLDSFKAVNDIHGHDVGDALLVALSLRMKEALREGDSLARIGGDEFVAVLANLAKVEDCELVLERLLLAASEPIKVGDVILNVSASIGVTLYPQDNVDADQLMRQADQAMYAAKESGKNRYHLFDTAQGDAVKLQQETLEAIRNALDKHQFVLYYQPKVNMRTGKAIGVEALIRWQHPKRGLLNPSEFLPVIENHPMMIELGEWVIETTLTQISQWKSMGLNLPISTSVNIAAVQLQQSGFSQKLTTLLAAHPDIEPSCLELEVLETSAIEDVDHVSTTMNACIAQGITFAIDDFGTGYSSLTYLRRLPANLIKIDQTFVRDMLIDANDLAIVEGVIALAKSFKREVIAEGVETIEHGTALLQLGCELAQGYGIAKPMPASDIPAWISEWKPDVSWLEINNR